MELTHRVLIYLFSHLLVLSSSLLGDETVRPEFSVDVIRLPQVSRFDFGVCRVNRPMRGKVWLTNRSGVNLQVREVFADCGCLSVVADKRTCAVGQRTHLDIELAASMRVAKLRRMVRVYFEAVDKPLVLKFDVSVTGPIQLAKTLFDVSPNKNALEIVGRKTQPGLQIDSLVSGRGGFIIDGEIQQDLVSFRALVKPLHAFGTFSDIVRIRYSDQNGQTQRIEVPVELQCAAKIRLLPSTVLMRRKQGRWIGTTRMVLSPREKPIDVRTLRFTFSGSDPTMKTEHCEVNLQPLSSVLSLVQVTMLDDEQQAMPHIVEIEDRNGSSLGTLHLSKSGEEQ